MLDFSFGELALVVLVAIVVVGPKDLPHVMRAIGRWAGQFKGIADEFRAGFTSVMHEHMYEAKKETQFIRDEQGNLQQVYDISDFLDDRSRAPQEKHES